ncbi:hypothetical protein H1S01_19660 [Heliobacterium chlorum]|uniref:PD-(D/E)XK endonuclease-like domain-containing protein n=1 Tax=Heliobacterium chlorum TaxID=2698 RepID=A0ABR7T7Q9_HELCL|nr:hypothetical protein [Heliobacterium chlorum]MBC9786661.1 hypothetical protein [Heliobacterium chlorum]
MVCISSLVNRVGAKELRQEVLSDANDRGLELTKAILNHFDAIHSIQEPNDDEIEKYLLMDELDGLNSDTSKLGFKKGVITFSPSSAYKCERELYFKVKKVEASFVDRFPYQRRWSRNGSAVHRAMQRDLLYAETHLDGPKFTVVRTKTTNRPAWEKNIRQVRQFERNGQRFQLYGMMDGVLMYQPDGSKIGLEFKTKSTTLGVIGEYKMKDAQADHKEQCIAYSLLFGLDEFLIVYESLAKDSWTKGAEAKPDMRAFYMRVTDEDRNRLLDKFADVAGMCYTNELPRAMVEKCFFCLYKPHCHRVKAQVAA